MREISGIKKQDFFISLSLFILGVVTRLPFISRLFNYWDGVEFAIAIKRYSPQEGFPCPLSHFLYVMTVKAVDLFIKNPHTSFLIQSIIGNSLFVVVVYWIGRAIFGRLNGILAALIVLFAPWFWYYSITTVPSMFVGFFGGVSVLGFYYAMFRKSNYGLYWGAIGFALLCGYRHQDSLFIFPLFLWVLVKTKPKDAVKALVLFGLTCLAWFIPLIVMSGGFSEYINLLREYSKNSRISQNIFSMPYDMAKTNFTIKIKILLLVYGIGILPLFYQLRTFFNFTSIVNDRRVRFFIVWIFPPVIFWLIFFGENAGYFMSTLTGLSIYLAWAIFETGKEISNLFKKNNSSRWQVLLINPGFLSWIFVLFLVLTNSFIFLYDWTPKERAPIGFLYQNYPQVAKKDKMQKNKLDYIKANMNPESTAILTTNWFFMQTMYYLPEFYVYQYDVIQFAGRESMREAYQHKRRRYFKCDNTFDFKEKFTALVLFDEGSLDWVEDKESVEVVEAGDGYHLYIIKRPLKKRLKFDYQRVFS